MSEIVEGSRVIVDGYQPPATVKQIHENKYFVELDDGERLTCTKDQLRLLS